MILLKAVHNQLTAHIGVSVAAYHEDPEECVKKAITEWNSERSHLPHTWNSLLSVLKDLNLEELCQQIVVSLLLLGGRGIKWAIAPLLK